MIAERIEADKKEKERMRKAGLSEKAIETILKAREEENDERN